MVRNKVYENMYTGSLVGHGFGVFAVWGYCVTKVNKRTSVVILNPKLLGMMMGSGEEEVEDAIRVLMAPDALSGCKVEGGSRLVGLGGHEYLVVPHKESRKRGLVEKRKSRTRRRRKRERKRHVGRKRVLDKDKMGLYEQMRVGGKTLVGVITEEAFEKIVRDNPDKDWERLVSYMVSEDQEGRVGSPFAFMAKLCRSEDYMVDKGERTK